jgi:hypothetical protein
MGGSDLFVGTLDVLILKAVSQGRMHGYAIASSERDCSRKIGA